MTSRRLVTCLVALLLPLALGMLTFGASRAAPSPGVAVPSHMWNCPDQGGSMPAKGADCQADCPLACSPIRPERMALDAPIRPYTRLHYDLAVHGLVGRALEPELPPPRRGRA